MRVSKQYFIMLILCIFFFVSSSDEESSQIFVPFVNVSITSFLYCILIIKIEDFFIIIHFINCHCVLHFSEHKKFTYIKYVPIVL
jgi:hypothetical protein